MINVTVATHGQTLLLSRICTMDPNAQEPNDSPNEPISSLINEYFDRRAKGEDVSPEDFAAEHLECAEDLKPYLEGLLLIDEARSRVMSLPTGEEKPAVTKDEFWMVLAARTVQGIGVPVLDPQITAFKMAEMMVDMRAKAGYPAVSRIGMWKKQPEKEYRRVRRWLSEHPSPVTAYYKSR